MLPIEKLSYWEKDIYFKNIDFTIVGSGIVGINSAIELRKNYPNANILILERGYLPCGASTKNAGFACFGSPTELLSDLNKHSEEEVQGLIKMRWKGLEKLRKNCGDKTIDYQGLGSYEVFNKQDQQQYEFSLKKLNYLNDLIADAIEKKNTFEKSSHPHFSAISGIIKNNFEGQINTGKMMQSLLNQVNQQNIKLLNGFELKKWEDIGSKVVLQTNHGELKTKKLLIATNGLSREILPELDVQPARAQVLVTKPIKKLPFRGTFHYQEGYYYFRNIGNRVLLGGGRNLDFDGETTTKLETSEEIIKALKRLLTDTILPNTSYEIESQWAGIMGVGTKKRPLLKAISNNVAVGVRLGGMGIAIGSDIGSKLGRIF